MFKHAAYLIIGYLSAYLVCTWVPVQLPFQMSEFIMMLILNPTKSFFSMILFTIGFILHSILIKSAFSLTYKILRNEGSVLEATISYCVFINFYLLFQIGFWQTLVLAAFTVLYGLATAKVQRTSLKKAHLRL
ncbi:hypothetical protein LIT25_17370 [Bacillus sp. F19]|nr:hypothetical protein LIT25_17370 [Bacillus sp. F19]